MTKRILSVILSIAILASLLACGGDERGAETSPSPTSASEQQPAGVTRGEWISRLADVMGYGEAYGAEPIFSDVPSGSDAFEGVQKAVAYNLIGIDAERFNPGGSATREFVAVTAAKAIGFTGEPKAQLGDISDAPDRDSIRFAVDNMLLHASGGRFNPGGAVMEAESREILRKIEAFTTITIDPGHTDTVTFQDGLIDLTSLAVVFDDPEAMTVTLPGDLPSGVTVGSVLMLPPGGEHPYGAARKVMGITQRDGLFVIETVMPAIEEVFTEIDVQGEYYPDYGNIVWAEGVSVSGIQGGSGLSAKPDTHGIQNLSHAAQPFGHGVQPLASSAMELSFSIEEGDLEIEATLSIRNLKATASIDYALFIPIRAGVLIEETHSIALSVKAGLEKEIPVCKIPIPIAPGISVMVNVSIGISGEIVMTLTNEVRSEIWLNIIDTGTATNGKILDNSWEFEIEATVEIGPILGVSLNLVGINLAEASAFIGVGARAATTFAASLTCMDLTLYVPFHIKFALLPQFDDSDSLSRKIDIWTVSNSPIRYEWHFEDGNRVELCSLDSQGIIHGSPDPAEGGTETPTGGNTETPTEGNTGQHDVEFITIRGVEYSTSRTKIDLRAELPRLTDTDIEPLMYMTNLTWLDLTGANISDLSPLSGLTSLTWLTLDYTHISDLSPLSGLTNLTNLGLNSNQISDVSPLSGLTNLTMLSLGGNQISDVSPLSGLTNLTRLYLDYNQISDVSPLSGLTYLTVLHLNGNQISDAQVADLQAALPDCRIWRGR